MGRLFRNSFSHKYSFIGKRRIKDGEAAAIWDSKGQYRIVEGPKFVRVFMSDVAFLDRFVAQPNEYLMVKLKDGRKEHIQGPFAMFKDPVVHQSITVEPALQLNDSEVVVVYSEPERQVSAVELIAEEREKFEEEKKKAIAEDKKSGKKLKFDPSSRSRSPSPPRAQGGIPRRLVKGPTQFIPKASEWTHEFKWHGRIPENKTKYKAGELQFTKLRTLPSTLYYNVSECRTSDDAELEVKLMLFYHMTDLEQMLDTTHDPIGEILNGLCADVIRFCSERTFLQFVQDTAKLNELDAFKVLQQRAARVGFAIDKVVFRGYMASSALQAMHNQAVSMRTKLRLETESQEQEEALHDMKLKKNMERAAREEEMAARKHQHGLRLQAEAHTQKMAQLRAESEQETKFLAELGAKGVDLTRYLCTKNQNRSVDSVKVFRIENSDESTREGSSTSSGKPHIHIG